MTALDAWHAANVEALETGLADVRERLEALAARNSPLPTVATEQPIPYRRARGFSRLFSLGVSEKAPAPPDPALLPPADAAVPAEAASTPSAQDEAGRPVPAIDLITARLGLSPFERQVLLLCAGLEFDTGFVALCRHAVPNASGPSFELALSALEDPVWDVMSPERPLRHWRLLEIHQAAGQPLITSALRADERIVNYLKGLNYLDDRLAPLLQPMTAPATLAPSQKALADAAAARIAEGSPPPLFQLLGASPGSKQALATSIAAGFGMTLMRLTGPSAPETRTDTDSFARLWTREALLMPVALYLDADALGADAAQAQTLLRLAESCGGLVFLASGTAMRGLARSVVTLDVARPSAAEQQAQWSTLLGDDAEAIAAQLAGQFDLDGDAIAAIAAGAPRDDDTAQHHAAIWAGALDQVRPVLDGLAQPIRPIARWEDLEMPARETALLRDIAAQVRHRFDVYDGLDFRSKLSRGEGISVLFAGESGTGKTMAAEVLANELGLMLYRIDLSAVVSKYIGETEKNLKLVFDAAEAGGAILLFDEADALFGKRSEVKDSHDRYANIELNYLLQRIEAFRGLAILTSNMKAALDQAFVRRLRFIVNFPFPGVPERTAMWRGAFPAKVDTAALDFARLARLNVTGGSIRNIALSAAFASVAHGSALTMPLLLDAARREFVKLERPVNEADFRWPDKVPRPAL